ncbi:bacteriocin-protection protein [Pedobacter frigiditerrae]|uniref:Bacteriocin-protection protein n=1 Tax=Pedobacter frigiditerrae TaxID=2530452 RepID=A0A4R0MRS0_9SPHI|nr:YdeI/OmpD-associated family protein [Pedobacter frigiditerrae]TCC89423.1 bacteriocin-protection protein [Pedobacter frigiditerrae]
MEPQFFEKPTLFREWLKKNHQTKTELLVGFYKVGSGTPSMSWPESVDEALCFGWIDGIRKSIDEKSYTIRFTPRKPTSIWSGINIKKMDELIKKGLMQPAGLTAFQHRKEEKSGVYIHENEARKLNLAFGEKFKANKKAWDFFSTQAPSYQKLIIGWIMGAKQEATQLSRLEKAIAESELLKRMR